MYLCVVISNSLHFPPHFCCAKDEVPSFTRACQQDRSQIKSKANKSITRNDLKNIAYAHYFLIISKKYL